MMIASAFCIPKNEKLNPLGEDAHFIAAEEETIGVADGVGGWSKKGIDPGEFARKLMKMSEEAVHKEATERRGGKVDLKRVLKEAFNNTKLPGSSTACILTHKDGVLRAVNVGDSGFMVFRDRKLFYKSRIQQRRFNHPYQLGNHEKCQRPDCAEEIEMAVMDGDLIVMGTDGLLDNMFPWEITKIIETEKEGWTTHELAIKIAQHASYRSLDRSYLSPFEIGSRMVGKYHRGGKVDDITVVVAKIYGCKRDVQHVQDLKVRCTWSWKGSNLDCFRATDGCRDHALYIPY